MKKAIVIFESNNWEIEIPEDVNELDSETDYILTDGNEMRIEKGKNLKLK